MSIRDDILAGLWIAEAGSVGDETPEELLARYDALKRAEVLAEAVEAARTEYLTDGTGTDEDNAYNNGVTDAIAAIGALNPVAETDPSALLDAYRAEVRVEVLAEAIKAANAEYKTQDITAPRTPYNEGVSDAVSALYRLAKGGA